MTTPSQPVNIRAAAPGRGGDYSGPTSPVGTPNIRALRSQYGTPPVNIPARGSNPQLQEGQTSNLEVRDGVEDPSNGMRPNSNGASGRDTPQVLEDLPEEEKIRILQRHLVSKEERRQNGREQEDLNVQVNSGGAGPSAGSGSAADSLRRIQRQETEPFPMPYDQEGGDVAYVMILHLFSFKWLI
jgi:solute carrier family 36 (proton-coupled amino acid transporter)